jgi:hypothetical protein
MGLMDAQEYDPRPAQRRIRLAIGAAVLLVVLLALWFWPSGRFHYMSEWNIANKFFTAIEQKNFDAAYGLYNADADWKQHPEKYNGYTLSQFTLDWGPASEYGIITSHEVDCAKEPPTKGFGSASGVIVAVILNHRKDSKDEALLWVEKKSHTITLAPSIWTVNCHPQ